jgi:hypothetical protein
MMDRYVVICHRLSWRERKKERGKEWEIEEKYSANNFDWNERVKK